MSLRPVSLLVAGSVALGALVAPAAASAQSYGRYGDRSYDNRAYDCAPTSRGNQTAGAVIGALAGAALGSNVAGRGAKSEGGVIGALAGAAIGAQAAKGRERCYDRSASGYGYGSGSTYGYGSSGYGQTSPYYGRDYSRGYGYGSDRDYPYSSDRDYDRDYRRPVSESGSLDGCRLAESPIYLPDGRTEKRYVRVCPDANGRYRVVD